MERPQLLRLVAGAALALFLGCDRDSSQRLESTLIDGRPIVARARPVLVEHRDPATGISEWCTGAWVAADIVLTARHCVQHVGAGRFECTEEGMMGYNETRDSGRFVGSIRSALVRVHAGASRDARALSSSAVSAISVEDGDTVCQADLAVLRVETPVADIDEIMTPAQRGAPTRGERVVLMGWGATASAWAPSTPSERSVSVLAIGPTSATDAGVVAGPGEWVAEGAGCVGDSGGPALDASGQLVGVISRGTGQPRALGAPPCFGALARTVARRVDPLAALIERLPSQDRHAPYDAGASTTHSTPPLRRAGGCAADGGGRSSTPWTVLWLIASLAVVTRSPRHGSPKRPPNGGAALLALIACAGSACAGAVERTAAEDAQSIQAVDGGWSTPNPDSSVDRVDSSTDVADSARGVADARAPSADASADEGASVVFIVLPHGADDELVRSAFPGGLASVVRVRGLRTIDARPGTVDGDAAPHVGLLTGADVRVIGGEYRPTHASVDISLAREIDDRSGAPATIAIGATPEALRRAAVTWPTPDEALPPQIDPAAWAGEFDLPMPAVTAAHIVAAQADIEAFERVVRAASEVTTGLVAQRSRVVTLRLCAGDCRLGAVDSGLSFTAAAHQQHVDPFAAATYRRVQEMFADLILLLTTSLDVGGAPFVVVLTSPIRDSLSHATDDVPFVVYASREIALARGERIDAAGRSIRSAYRAIGDLIGVRVPELDDAELLDGLRSGR